MKFVKKNQDRWHLPTGDGDPLTPPQPQPYRLLTLEQWHAVRDGWPTGLPTGVIVPNNTEIEILETDLSRLDLVALHFPKWVDGRAYSQAHILRSRLRFRGEVRATGDVVVDMMPLLQRTGFDAVVLRDDQKREHAEQALGFFRAYYQGDLTPARPRFTRPTEQHDASEFARHEGSV